MKTNTFTFKTFATGIVAAVFLFTTSCKKGDTGPMGANGANGQDGVVPTSTDGFIKGNISGTRQDGTAFNESFEYKNYWGGPSGTLDSNSVTSYAFVINRGSDVLGENNARITVNVTSRTATSGNITLNDFSYTKSLGNNKRFEFTLNNTPTTTITGLSYNTSSGLYTGNFSFTVSGFQNSTGNTATISGSFEATITQIYNMMMNTGKGVSLKK